MTAKIKLNAASGGGSISIQAPSSSSNNRVISLPDIADGTLVTSQSTLDATKLSGALPAISGANLTGLSAGIQVAEKWHLNGNFNVSSASTYMVVRSTQGYWSKSGSGSSHSFHGSIPSTTSMTQASGLFTFPSTGIWLVIYDCLTGTANDQLNMWSYIAVGSDTSANTYASVLASSGDAGTMNTTTHTALIDVTNVSNQKVHFRSYHAAVGGYVSGNTSGERTQATFIRLGDT